MGSKNIQAQKECLQIKKSHFFWHQVLHQFKSNNTKVCGLKDTFTDQSELSSTQLCNYNNVILLPNNNTLAVNCAHINV